MPAEALDEPQVLFHCYDGLAAALLDVDDLAGARDYLQKAQALSQERLRAGLPNILLNRYGPVYTNRPPGAPSDLLQAHFFKPHKRILFLVYSARLRPELRRT